MANDFKEVVELPEFKKDLKKLLKRFPTFDEDMENFISAQLVLFHKLGLDNNGIFRLTDLGFDNPPVFKAKKFACRSLKGRGAMSGIRVGSMPFVPIWTRLNWSKSILKATRKMKIVPVCEVF